MCLKSCELVAKTIKGEKTKRTPIYGWVSGNLWHEITEAYGSVNAFEDHYEFDCAHIFGGPGCFDEVEIAKVRENGEELTPDILLDIPLRSPDNMEEYKGIIDALKYYKDDRGRFCYMQTPGFFENYNGVFGIENHLCYLILYKEEIKELYRRQSIWNAKFAENVLDLGVDMVHISDDWGSQRDLMFSPKLWWELIYPNMKYVVDKVHAKGGFASLHSDGCIMPIVDGLVDIGFDVIHPWQETAGMSYDVYLDKYQDKFAILGGLCVQSTIGFGDYERLGSEIRRVFNLLKGKRWIFCTTHFVQKHCTIEELSFAYDLIYKLSHEM